MFKPEKPGLNWLIHGAIFFASTGTLSFDSHSSKNKKNYLSLKIIITLLSYLWREAHRYFDFLYHSDAVRSQLSSIKKIREFYPKRIRWKREQKNNFARKLFLTNMSSKIDGSVSFWFIFSLSRKGCNDNLEVTQTNVLKIGNKWVRYRNRNGGFSRWINCN